MQFLGEEKDNGHRGWEPLPATAVEDSGAGLPVENEADKSIVAAKAQAKIVEIKGGDVEVAKAKVETKVEQPKTVDEMAAAVKKQLQQNKASATRSREDGPSLPETQKPKKSKGKGKGKATKNIKKGNGKAEKKYKRLERADCPSQASSARNPFAALATPYMRVRKAPTTGSERMARKRINPFLGKLLSQLRRGRVLSGFSHPSWQKLALLNGNHVAWQVQTCLEHDLGKSLCHKKRFAFSC